MNIHMQNSLLSLSSHPTNTILEHQQYTLSPDYKRYNMDEYQSSVIINDINVEEELSKIENNRKDYFKMLSMSFYARPRSHSNDVQESKRSRKSSTIIHDVDEYQYQLNVRAKSCADTKKKGKLLQQEKINLVKKKTPLINDLEVRLDQFCPKILLPENHVIKVASNNDQIRRKSKENDQVGRYGGDRKYSKQQEANRFQTAFDSVPLEDIRGDRELEMKRLSNSELCNYAEGLLELLLKSQKIEGEVQKSKNKAFDAILHEMWNLKTEEVSFEETGHKESNKVKKNNSKGETRSFLYEKSSTTGTGDQGRSFQVSSDSQSRVFVKQGGQQEKGVSNSAVMNRKTAYGNRKESPYRNSVKRELGREERETKSRSKEKRTKRDSKLEVSQRIKTEERSPSLKSENKKAVVNQGPTIMSRRAMISVDKDLEYWDKIPISISQGEITRKGLGCKRDFEKKSPERKEKRKESPNKGNKPQGGKGGSPLRTRKDKSFEQV